MYDLWLFNNESSSSLQREKENFEDQKNAVDDDCHITWGELSEKITRFLLYKTINVTPLTRIGIKYKYSLSGFQQFFQQFFQQISKNFKNQTAAHEVFRVFTDKFESFEERHK